MPNPDLPPERLLCSSSSRNIAIMHKYSVLVQLDRWFKAAWELRFVRSPQETLGSKVSWFDLLYLQAAALQSWGHTKKKHVTSCMDMDDKSSMPNPTSPETLQHWPLLTSDTCQTCWAHLTIDSRTLAITFTTERFLNLAWRGPFLRGVGGSVTALPCVSDH